MSSKCYTEQILPILLNDPKWIRQDLTLIQDGDSGHKAKATKDWAKKNSFKIITLPSNSPDFSIIETMAAPIKRKFHAERTMTQKRALARFIEVFEYEMDQQSIQNCFDKYTKRLWECKDAKGQMTHY